MSAPDIDFTAVMGLMSRVSSEVDLSKFQGISLKEIAIYYKINQQEKDGKTEIKFKIDMSPQDANIESRIVELIKVINILLTEAKNPPVVKCFKVTDNKQA